MTRLKHGAFTLFLLVTGLVTASPLAHAETHIVEVGDNFFSPSQLTIQVGDTVQWVNAAGGLPHDVESDDGVFSSGATATEFTYEFTFDEPGEYPYYCSLHGAPGGVGMSGLIIVESAEEPPFVINPGLNDAWYNQETSGQGLLLAVYPDIEQMFLAWFTFDTELPPEDATAVIGDPGHRWVTALGGWVDNVVTLDVALTTGLIFDQPTQGNPTMSGYGTIVIEFHDCNTATLDYTFPGIPLEGSIDLTRIVSTGETVALCQAYQEMAPEE